MRAIRFHETGGAAVLRLDDIQRPRPGAGEVVIKVATAGVNQTDIALRLGALPAPTVLPVIPGSEVAGVVTAAGDGVDPRLLGVRVAALSRTGMGGYAEEMVTSQDYVVPIPDRLDFDRATAVTAQGTAALGLLTSARLRPGERVLVKAATGEVGRLLVQLAKQRGATVVAAERGSARLALARKLGADIAVDHTEPGWGSQVRDAVGGDYLDVVLETTGAAPTKEAYDLLTPVSGRMVLCGKGIGQPSATVPARQVHRGLGTLAWRRPGFIRKALERALLLTAYGKLDPLIVARYSLSEASQAHEFVEGRTSTGKTLLHL